jgi:predicted  nucleic acid-binding Zn-ribbon protein
MSKISQMIKQNQEKKNQQNLIYQEKLKQLIHNNNSFVQELKKLEEINSNSESRLIELRNDLEYVEDLYIQLFTILEDTSERFQSIQDRMKEDKKSNTDKKSSLKSSKPSKKKTIKEVSSEVDLNRIRTVLNTLLTHYDKTLTVNK